MAVEVTPEEMMYFRQPLVEKPNLTMTIKNHSSRHVVFRIKTTAPKHYTTKPHQGIILPGEMMSVLVTVVGWKEEPILSQLKLKDKFLIQSAVVPYGQENEIVQDIMAKAMESERTGLQVITQRKLRVCYLPPEPRGGINEPDNDDVAQQTDGSDFPGVGGSGVLVDHHHAHTPPPYPLPHEHSGSSLSSPEASTDPRGHRALDESTTSVTSHEPSGAWHEGASELMQSFRKDVKSTVLDTVASTSTSTDPAANQASLKQRKMSEYYIDDTASKVEATEPDTKPSTHAAPAVSISDRIPLLLSQSVPLWTVIAAVAATYTATHFFKL